MGRKKSDPIAYRAISPGVWHNGDWKATTLKAEVWVDTVTESGRMLMAVCRK